MKIKFLRIICRAVLLLLCLFIAIPVAADTIDFERQASLTLVYQYDGVPYPDLEIKTFRVADISEEYHFTLAGQFAQYPVKLYAPTSQTEWNIICQTLQSYVWADQLKPTATGRTDEEGTVVFQNLTPGLYLTMPISHLGEEATTEFYGFLSVIPQPKEDGSHDYDVTAYPKSGQFAPADGDARALRVIKQWKDSGFQENRPESIHVDIYCNGVFKANVILSAANNWSHGWVAEDDGAVWTAVEREIPEEYTVTVEYKGDTIILTNVREVIEDPPKSGDSTVLWPFLLGMLVSGFAAVLLAVSLNKKDLA